MKLISRLLILIVFLGLLAGLIAFARGYRINFQEQNITSTGIIAVSAFPKGSKVYINQKLMGASDINLTLPPGNYEVEVKKDGYTSWKKTVKLKGELVLGLDVLLYPINPSLSPLTNLSVVKAVPINQSNKVILFSENEDELKDGIYLFEESGAPISFFTPLKLLALKKNLMIQLGEFSLKDSEVKVSPDAKEAIFTFKSLRGDIAYLLNLNEENTGFFDISNSTETLTQAWFSQIEEVNQKILNAYPKDIAKVASDSFHVVEFSPDESKILYLAKQSIALPLAIHPPLIAVNQTPETRTIEQNSLYVYDKKEDKNYQIDLKFDLGTFNQENKIGNDITGFYNPASNFSLHNTIAWYSDSKHLVINEGKKISFIDYDNQNKQTVYSGIYDGTFFKVTSDGKVLLLTNFNPEANKYPDLYAVGIR